MRFVFLCLCLLAAVCLWAQVPKLQTPFEQSNKTATATYSQLRDYYQELCSRYSVLQLDTIGYTDGGNAIWSVVYDADKNFDAQQWKREGKLVIFINNGIHAGEPDGIDASMMLLRDVANGKIKVDKKIVLVVIPVFNADGMLHRRTSGRANQNGPSAMGFRASGRNLDLNRDFMKKDARETQALIKYFVQCAPHIFIDNHVSNGADYQHVMTLLTPNDKKLGTHLGAFLKNVYEPALYQAMKKKGYDLIPYVNHWGHTPDKGWVQFYESPRFASGFAALHHAIPLVPETHMLKPFKQRVAATYHLMDVIIAQAGQYAKQIWIAQEKEKQAMLAAKHFVLDWKADTSTYQLIPYKGYAAAYKTSAVTGAQRLYYNRQKPYDKWVPFYNNYQPVNTTIAPQAYVVPKAWQQVIERLLLHGVQMMPLAYDTLINVTVKHLVQYETVKTAYEGHYLHYNIKTEARQEVMALQAGDMVVPVQQAAKRYLIEALEAEAPDGFFAWNFFDAILQQKEWYSDYVFEDEAAAMLEQNPSLKKEFYHKKQTDSAFAKDANAQLYYLYRKSKHMEQGFMRYPVYSIY